MTWTHARFGIPRGLCIAAFAYLPFIRMASAEELSARPAFCPPGYEVIGSVCVGGTNGDVVLPATRGEAYRKIRDAFDTQTLCSAWDIHIMTQIEDFAQEDAFPTGALVLARIQREEAQRHMRARRYTEALAIYERIFTDIEP